MIAGMPLEREIRDLLDNAGRRAATAPGERPKTEPAEAVIGLREAVLRLAKEIDQLKSGSSRVG
jgi:hypothetical protein